MKKNALPFRSRFILIMKVNNYDERGNNTEISSAIYSRILKKLAVCSLFAIICHLSFLRGDTVFLNSFSYSNKRSALFFSFLIAFCMMLSGCPGKEKENGSQNVLQDSQKGLSLLNEIEKTNERIIQILGGPANLEEKEEEKSQQGQTSQQNQPSGQAQQEQQPSGETQQEQQPSGQTQQEQQPQEQKISAEKWALIDQYIVQMHTLLNDYMPLAIKQGAGSELTVNANNALNSLTDKAEIKSRTDVLFASNLLHKYLCEFYALQQEKTAPLKQLLFDSRGVVLAGMVADWKTSYEFLSRLKNDWQAQKPSYDETQKELVSKLDLSINALQKVAEQGNKKLVEIKGRIVVKNIADLEKSIKESEQKKQSQ